MIERLADFLRRKGVRFDTFGAVFDIGSRDALQAIELADLFPNAQIVAIECNPNTLELCRQNIAAHPRIRLVEKAIHSYTGRCQFHPIDGTRTVTSWPDGNQGASSLFLATADYPVERYVQNTVEVDCIRLDALCGELGIDVIDLIWIDLQGAELLALQSAGALLEKTRYVYTEVSHRPLYQGQCLFDDVDAFLKAQGFRCCSHVDRERWQQDLIYENTRPLAATMISRAEPTDPHGTATAAVTRSNLQPHSPELRLLLACGHLAAPPQDVATIRTILEGGINWTSFADTAIDHGMAGMAAHNLLRVAPKKVPSDIADALRTHVEQTRRKNMASMAELARILRTLAESGIEAISLKGPVLAQRLYAGLGLRVFRDLDFIVRDADMPRTMAILLQLGYRRQMTLTPAQIEMIQYLQGQEFVYGPTGLGAEPHTRLTSVRVVLDIDYAGLWHRARQTVLGGRPIRVLEPVDELIALAVHGTKELWWNIKWVCDVARFIDTHPSLDWPAVLARASTQGCLRMVLLAASLADTFFHATPPQSVREAIHNDARIAPLTSRILARWESGKSVGPPSGNRVSLDLLRLHQGFGRRLRHVARTLLLPGPHHVAYLPLPRSMRFAYVPFKLVHDIVALPLWIGYRRTQAYVVSLLTHRSRRSA